MKKVIVGLMMVGMLFASCDKDNDGPNENNGGDDCHCGVVISVEYDSAITDGYIQNRYDVKARNECSNNIKEFTQVPDNGDYVPSEGEYWCRKDGKSW